MPERGERARCGTCGTAFEATKRDHRWCSADCRLVGHARKRLDQLQGMLTGVENLRLYLLGEIERYAGLADGQRAQRKGLT